MLVITLSELSQAEKHSTARSHSYVESTTFSLVEIESTFVVPELEKHGAGRRQYKERLIIEYVNQE